MLGTTYAWLSAERNCSDKSLWLRQNCGRRIERRRIGWIFSAHLRALFAVQNDPQIFSHNSSRFITPCLVAAILKFHRRELFWGLGAARLLGPFWRHLFGLLGLRWTVLWNYLPSVPETPCPRLVICFSLPSCSETAENWKSLESMSKVGRFSGLVSYLILSYLPAPL